MQVEGSPHFNESALHLACSHSRDTDPSSGNRLHARVHSLGEQVVQRCKTTHSPVICIITLPLMQFGSECSVWHLVNACCFYRDALPPPSSARVYHMQALSNEFVYLLIPRQVNVAQ